MARLRSQIQPNSEEFRNNYAAMQNHLLILKKRLTLVGEGGGKKGAEKFRKQQKKMPRERIEMLLDADTFFLEIAPLAAWDMYDGETPGASLITGIGQVCGIDCMIIANDATVKGGAIYPISVQKKLRCQEIAECNRLPTIYLVESAGANLLYQSEFFAHLGGRIFANQARMSALGIPQISLVFGNSTAGGAYVCGLADYTVMVREQAKVFLGGPPLVKMATGEDVDDETLGGADMHTSVSGVGDYIAQDDADAIRIGRDIIRYLNWNKFLFPGRISACNPHYDPDELLGIVSINKNRLFCIREIIARIVDDSSFVEFKTNYAPTLVAGHAYIDGFPVGILGNNGVLFAESALKGAQFIQLCNQTRIPIVYLQNITGFMIGSEYERGGMVKHGAKMINAVANSTVPQFTVIVGASYGAGNYAMCGRAYDPRLMFSWPSSHIAVMGEEQMVGVLSIIHRQAAKARGIEPDKERLAKKQAAITEQFAYESSPYYATARLWDDGIIDPRDTRKVLSIGLSIACNRDFWSQRENRYGVFRM